MGAAAALGVLLGGQAASAETRSLKLYHLHTGEKAEIVFKRNGRYDPAGLQKVNVILRDWRRNEPTKMNPRLLDLVWEAYREAGATGYIDVVCGYRSPGTNSMLRSRSRGVAEHSQHMLGNAMDFFIPGVPLKKLREIGLKMQGGGVGYYPTSGSPFVHMDVGNVRHWPRMSRKELLALFPGGKTLHVPSDGKPLPGFDQALAAYNARKSAGSLAIASAADSTPAKRRSFFAALFGRGGGEDDAEDSSAVAMAEDAQTAPAVKASQRLVKAMPAAKPAATASAAARQPGIRIVPPSEAERVNLPVRQDETLAVATASAEMPETVIAALSPREVPLPVAAPRLEVPRPEDAPALDAAVTKELTAIAAATPAKLSAEPPPSLGETASDVAANIPLPTWRPLEEAPVVLAALSEEKDAEPAGSGKPATVLAALASARNTQEKAADLVAPLPSERPVAPTLASLASNFGAEPDPKPAVVASAGANLPAAAMVPGLSPANDEGEPDDQAVLAAAKEDAKRSQIELASLNAEDKKLAYASAFADLPLPSPKPKAAASGDSPRKPVAAAKGKGGRNLAATLFSNVRTTEKEARPSRQDLKPEAHPVLVDAQPSAARWAIYGDKVATVTTGTKAPSFFAHDLVRAAPREVYTAGFQQGPGPEAVAGRFTGKSVTFLTVARFQKNAN